MTLTPDEQRARRRDYMRRYFARPEVKARVRKYQDDHKDQINTQARVRYRVSKSKRIVPPKVRNQKERRDRELEILAGRPKPEFCEACGGNKGGIVFDHDHRTGRFRGWICWKCNVVLGLVGDDPDRLRKIAAILKRKNAAPQFTLQFDQSEDDEP